MKFRHKSFTGRPPVRCVRCRERVKETWRKAQKEKKEK